MNFDDLKDEYLKLIYQAMKNVPSEYFEIKTAGNTSSKKENVYIAMNCIIKCDYCRKKISGMKAIL